MQQFTIGKFTNFRPKRSQPRSSFDLDRFQRWRATVPYTNEDIARVFIAMSVEIEQENAFMAKRYLQTADWIRAGHLSMKVVNAALPALINKCALCGKRALYRYGYEGRCRDHKYNATVGMAKRTEIVEKRSSDIAAAVAAIDRAVKTNKTKHQLHRGRKQKK